jgi:hypothetical protein
VRAAVLVGLVALAAAAIPRVPAPVAALVCLAVGATVAQPGMAAAAVRQGHALAAFAPGGLLRRWTGGGALRVLVHGAAGVALAALLLLHLATGGPAAWVAAAAAVPATLAAAGLAAPLARREGRGAHAARAQRWIARLAAVSVVLALAALAGALGLGPDPLRTPPAASLLVAEGFEAMRLAEGARAALFGHAAALGLWPRWAENAALVVLTAGVAWSASSLALAAAMPPGDWRRALGPASDAAAPPPPARGAVAAAAAVVAGTLALAVWAEGRLAATPAAARPAASVQKAVEVIAGALHPPGTIAALEALSVARAAEDAALRAALPGAINAGFDAMAANVDPFLDRYYTLGAEYLRLYNAVTGGLEAALARDLEAALTKGAPFAAFEALRDRAAALAQPPAAQLPATQPPATQPPAAPPRDAAPVNPARLRVTAERPAPVAMPVIAAPGLVTAVGTRLAVAGLGGTVVALVARRVVTRLAARGVIRVLAGTLVLPATVLIDWGLVKAEAALNRDAFRAEIMAAIEAARAEALAALE